MKKDYKPQLYSRRCCYNCTHHLAYISDGPNRETIVCAIFAQKEYPTEDGKSRIGIDYKKRIPADHVPCKYWQVDTNNPKGFSWPFLSNDKPQELSLDF